MCWKVSESGMENGAKMTISAPLGVSGGGNCLKTRSPELEAFTPQTPVQLQLLAINTLRRRNSSLGCCSRHAGVRLRESDGLYQGRVLLTDPLTLCGPAVRLHG